MRIAIIAALTEFRWNRLTDVLAGATETGDRGREAAEIVTRLRVSLESDEIVKPLASALRTADEDAFEWVRRGAVTVRIPSKEPRTPGQAQGGEGVVAAGADRSSVINRLQVFLDEHRDADVDVRWRIVE